VSLFKSVAIHDERSPPAASVPIEWATGELAGRLAAAGADVTRAAIEADLTIAIRNDRKASAAAARGAEIELPSEPESFALFTHQGTLVVWGADTRGIVYALTELADRAKHGEQIDARLPLCERPTMRVRSIARVFASEAEDKPWFYDRQMWLEYLTMLATNRYNRFSLTLGLQYNFPYHNNLIRDVYFYFPYPFLLDLPGYDVKVKGLSTAEREANLDILRFIGKEAGRRGLDFQLALWTQRYDFDETPHASHVIEGVTSENLAPYCRDSIAALLSEVPQITGLTFRVHVEGGIAEGDYTFWETAFEGITNAGRPIEIDMHGKGLDHKMLDVATATGMPVATSPKYIAEHMALPYHAADIRSREHPPRHDVTNREQLSLGARKFLRYSYGDLLSKDRRWKVIYRVWPGSQRVLIWGDPSLAAGYGKSGAFLDSDGIEFCEPLTFKGRMGTGLPGGRALYRDPALVTKYDWQKYEYQYRVWGRLTYDPSGDAEGYRRHLKTQCGDAASHCELALAAASKILPLITQAHGPSVSNNMYWPEIYTNLSALGPGPRRPYGYDMDTPTRFGNVPTFDPQLFATAKEFAEALFADEPVHRYTPLDVADWLENFAEAAELEIVKARRTASYGRPEVQRILLDCEIASGVGRFFAEKFRAACFVELFLLTGSVTYLKRASALTKRARLGWRAASNVGNVYHDDLTFGPQIYMRGSWGRRLTGIDDEISELDTWRTEDVVLPRAETSVVERLQATLDLWRPTVSGTLSLGVPATFERGEDIDVNVDVPEASSAMLYYRHVNQAERWQAQPMESGRATIPAEYTDSNYHLQIYVVVTEPGLTSIHPGLDIELADEPYVTILQR
jgi:hypothetical protein